MALYHFHVEQIKRSEGRTAVASAAYRAGEKLHNLWDRETHDYTKKGGVILSEIILPEYAPERFSDRYTLWNEVEQIEKHYKAQLAYSFDMALQNEFSLEENIALAREFVQKYFSDFVSEVYLYDDRLLIYFNISSEDGKLKSADLSNIEGGEFDEGLVSSLWES